jgi:hypothetical protein
MADIPEDDLEETRAALAPTLEATAAILPWLAKPREARFETKLNQRWIAACSRLAAAWSARHGEGADDIRPAIFALYAIALETADADCLHLGEALASAADRLEENNDQPRLNAALSACIECLTEPAGLEHVLFAERAQHFARRLENCIGPDGREVERSAILDQLFVKEAEERLERMREALDALPLDAYALKVESAEILQQAEHLDLYGIIHLGRQLQQAIPGNNQADETENPANRDTLLGLLTQLESAIAAVVA